MIRLTPEEIDKLTAQELAKLNEWQAGNGLPPTTWLGELDPEVVAKAQLKKVVEWGNEPCEEHYYQGRPQEGDAESAPLRRDCPECWQTLLKEAE